MGFLGQAELASDAAVLQRHACLSEGTGPSVRADASRGLQECQPVASLASTMSDAEGAKSGMNTRCRFGFDNFVPSQSSNFVRQRRFGVWIAGVPKPFLGVGKCGSLAAPQLS
eukprot:CAMPEP_0181525326 /NCGR_PEP_ID=MMETSP1110-20121109/68909_1 /TAXON_ID=174948 /ORGANISM="Symbiodinium sp., Strain CCMP421" /LENGTH=112 /DNA_ID=CAMNT_0023656125 /DNA_START=924 /DNA_END=1262 /DNA_ORIENTATION=+